jgi:hypothetical protein
VCGCENAAPVDTATKRRVKPCRWGEKGSTWLGKDDAPSGMRRPHCRRRLRTWPGTGCWGAEGSGPLTECCCPAASANSLNRASFHRTRNPGQRCRSAEVQAKPSRGPKESAAQPPVAQARISKPFQKLPESLIKTAAWFGEKRSAYSASPVSGRSFFSWCFESRLLRAGAACRSIRSRI